MLTTAVDTGGGACTLRTTSTLLCLVSQTPVDSRGPAKPPEKRKVGGSTPPLTTSSRSIGQPSHLRESQEERILMARDALLLTSDVDLRQREITVRGKSKTRLGPGQELVPPLGGHSAPALFIFSDMPVDEFACIG